LPANTTGWLPLNRAERFEFHGGTPVGKIPVVETGKGGQHGFLLVPGSYTFEVSLTE
jgi:hypothetical protein